MDSITCIAKAAWRIDCIYNIDLVHPRAAAPRLLNVPSVFVIHGSSLFLARERRPIRLLQTQLLGGDMQIFRLLRCSELSTKTLSQFHDIFRI